MSNCLFGEGFYTKMFGVFNDSETGTASIVALTLEHVNKSKPKTPYKLLKEEMVKVTNGEEYVFIFENQLPETKEMRDKWYWDFENNVMGVKQ